MVAALPARLSSPTPAVPRSISRPFGMRHSGVARAFVNRHIQTGPLPLCGQPEGASSSLLQRLSLLLALCDSCRDAARPLEASPAPPMLVDGCPLTGRNASPRLADRSVDAVAGPSGIKKTGGGSIQLRENRHHFVGQIL
jgi:hypothetical protein